MTQKCEQIIQNHQLYAWLTDIRVLEIFDSERMVFISGRIKEVKAEEDHLPICCSKEEEIPWLAAEVAAPILKEWAL